MATQYVKYLSLTFREGDFKINIGLDGWSAPNKMSFLGVTACYLDKDWKLMRVLLGMERIHGK